jgi:tetratricopeptide (TPR) repeat protein
VVVSLLAGLVATLRLADVARKERDLARDARNDAVQSAAIASQERDAARDARNHAEQMAAVASRERDAASEARERAEHEADHARIEASSNHLVAAFLADTFLSSRRLADPAERTRVLATIRQRADQVRRQHGDGNDHLCANLLQALGRACTELDAFADAEALLQESARIRRAAFGEQSLETALSFGSLGQLWYRQGRFAEAREALTTSYRLHKECDLGVHTDVAQAANDLAAAERALGNVARARALHEEALALRREGGDEVLVAESLSNLANSEPDRGKAERYLDEALRLRTEVLGPDHPLTIQSRSNLGSFCVQIGAFERAHELLAEAVERGRALAGLGIEGLPVTLRAFAYANLRLQRVDDAQAAITEAITLDAARLPADHPRLAGHREVLATILEQRGEWRDAVATWREVLRVRTTALPAGHRQIALAQVSLGNALVRMQQANEALPLLDVALTALQQPGAQANATDVLAARIGRGLAREATGDLAGAEQDLLGAFADEGKAGPSPRGTPTARGHLHAFYRRQGREGDAAKYAPTPPAATGR